MSAITWFSWIRMRPGSIWAGMWRLPICQAGGQTRGASRGFRAAARPPPRVSDPGAGLGDEHVAIASDRVSADRQTADAGGGGQRLAAQEAALVVGTTRVCRRGTRGLGGGNALHECGAIGRRVMPVGPRDCRCGSSRRADQVPTARSGNRAARAGRLRAAALPTGPGLALCTDRGADHEAGPAWRGGRRVSAHPGPSVRAACRRGSIRRPVVDVLGIVWQ